MHQPFCKNITVGENSMLFIHTVTYCSTTVYCWYVLFVYCWSFEFFRNANSMFFTHTVGLIFFVYGNSILLCWTVLILFIMSSRVQTKQYVVTCAVMYCFDPLVSRTLNSVLLSYAVAYSLAQCVFYTFLFVKTILISQFSSI